MSRAVLIVDASKLLQCTYLGEQVFELALVEDETSSPPSRFTTADLRSLLEEGTPLRGPGILIRREGPELVLLTDQATPWGRIPSRSLRELMELSIRSAGPD